MSKILMAVLVMVVAVMALDNVTVPHTWVTGDTIKRDWMKSNSDTIYTRMNSLNDSLEKKWMRFADVKDSTFQKVNCDSIRSNPDVDSIQGNPLFDTVSVTTGIRFGSGSYLNSYSNSTFACTLKLGDSTRAGTAYYEKIGNMVFLTIPQFAFVNAFTPPDSGQLRNIPSAIRPSTVSYVSFGFDSMSSGNVFNSSLALTLRNSGSFKVSNAALFGGTIAVTAFGCAVYRQTIFYYKD
jgi:hypothetical protein